LDGPVGGFGSDRIGLVSESGIISSGIDSLIIQMINKRSAAGQVRWVRLRESASRPRLMAHFSRGELAGHLLGFSAPRVGIEKCVRRWR